MKLIGKIARWRRASSPPPVAPSLPSPAEAAAAAREDELYSIGSAAALDNLGLMKVLMMHRHRPITRDLATVGRRCSMLHLDVLILLYYLARHTEGDILEIGPYLGGSTIATAKGVRAAGRGRSFVTIEQGGQMDHPTLPSGDIVTDLRANLAGHGVADLVQLIVGSASEEETVASVRRGLRPGSVGFLIMDADGAVQPALAAYRDLLSDRCWVMIDDYYAPVGPALEKAATTRTQVDLLVASGELETVGFYGWGTWFGRWHRAARHDPNGRVDIPAR